MNSTVSNNKSGTVNSILDKLAHSNDTHTSIINYKPVSNKYHPKITYSINELVQLKSNVSASLIHTISNQLPSRKFWRLHQRFNSNSDTSHYHHPHQLPNVRSGTITTTTTSNEFQRYDKSKNRLQRPQNKPGVPSVATGSNLDDDIIEFDDHFVPSGNSIKDFELWKAKMKEIEQSKKKKKSFFNIHSSTITDPSPNVDPQGNTTRNDPSGIDTPILKKSSSRISDFLKLSNIESNTNNKPSMVMTTASEVTLNSNSNQDSLPHNEQSSNLGSGSRSSSSKFSSFFNNTNKSTQDNTLDTKMEEINENNNSNNKTDSNTSAKAKNGTSRLMNFFKETSRSNTPLNETLTLNDNNTRDKQGITQRNFNLPVQNSIPTMGQQQNLPFGLPYSTQGPNQIQQVSLPTMHGSANNTFFQGLLNKNKTLQNNNNLENNETGASKQLNSTTKKNTTATTTTNVPNNPLSQGNMKNAMGIPPPPGILPPPPGIPPQNFRMMPPNMMGHPMMQGIHPLPPPPGIMQFPPDLIDKDKNKNDTDSTGNDTNKNINSNNPQHRFYPIMPPPNGFVPNMQHLPPNLQQYPQFMPNMQQIPAHMHINDSNVKDNNNSNANNNVNMNQPNNNVNNLQRFFPNMTMNPQRIPPSQQK